MSGECNVCGRQGCVEDDHASAPTYTPTFVPAFTFCLPNVSPTETVLVWVWAPGRRWTLAYLVSGRWCLKGGTALPWEPTHWTAVPVPEGEP